MPDPTRMPGFFHEPSPRTGPVFGTSRTDFFREEFVKHRECLVRQREYYSERTITCVEAALTRLIAQVEQLSAKEDADQFVTRLLRKLDAVTGLSYWSDSRGFH